MSNLSKLKIVAQAAKRQQTKSEHRRAKLLEKLEDQLAMIEAQINGEVFTRMRRIWRTDEMGERVLKSLRGGRAVPIGDLSSLWMV
jgi:hypothetical protein